jgi:hypothetical protein
MTYQDLVLHGHPHQLQQGLGLLGGQDVIPVDPFPVLQRSLELSVHHRRSRSSGRGRPIDVETAGAVDTEAVQESLGTSDGFEFFEALGVDQGSKDERFLEERGGVGGIVGRIDMRRSPGLSGVLLLGHILVVVVDFELGVLFLAEKTFKLGHSRTFVDLGRRLVHEHRVDVSRLLIVPLLAGVPGRARAEMVGADIEKGPVRRGEVMCSGFFVGRLEADRMEVVVPRITVQDTRNAGLWDGGSDKILGASVRFVEVGSDDPRRVRVMVSHGGGKKVGVSGVARVLVWSGDENDDDDGGGGGGGEEGDQALVQSPIQSREERERGVEVIDRWG